MNKEREFIRIILNSINRERTSSQTYFCKDAEPFRIDEKDLLFTTDEFSQEDLFRDHDPEVLGWNLAAATISDIYAAGGAPLFYGHSMVVPPGWGSNFIQHFSRGIACCLSVSETQFIGGDMGFADTWHYTGIAIGEKITPLTRQGAKAGDLIYISGLIGKGNFEAALNLYSNNTLLKPLLSKHSIRFPVRKPESGVIRNFANCCIDSSDGVFRALQNLAEINEVGFTVTDLPYAADALLACRLLGKPRELLFFGESGEYELLFVVSPEKEKELLKAADKQNLRFNKLGSFTESKDYLLIRRGKSLDLKKMIFYARDYTDTKSYLSDLINALKDENYTS